MSEFCSQLEDLISVEELIFDATPGFGSVYKRFLSHAIAHPAKMNTRLTEFLVEKFTAEGDIVLDPMSGTGQTGVISALRGRDSVCVELEEKFFGWMEKARKKVERQRTLAVKGKIKNVLGDARKLSMLLKDVDVVVTSPPYSSEAVDGRKTFNKTWQGLSEQDGKKKRGSLIRERYSINDNIANLPHGQIDVIVTSPPYKTANEGGGLNKNPPKTFRGVLKNHSFKISDNPENIDNLPFGNVDAVITSPPYADAKKGGEVDEEKMAERWDRTAKERNWNTWGKTWKTEGRKRALKSLGSGYSESEENIGNLPFADAVITSPPYEAAMSAKVHTLNTEKQRKLYGEKHWATQYGETDDQIGNLSKETYLEAMLKVYMEMYKVLKSNGKAIIIIKPFIRNKKVVDLPFHTYLLLKKAGFKLTKLFKLRLKQQSFWRILYNKKYPKVPQIQHEYILVCQKNE